jgi:exosome complex RNA-binding protein Rrp42 (RNase PH superfamily)
MEKVFISSRAIDKESLCIANGKLVWEISVEISILAYDGNSIDPTFFAALMCLSSTSLPQVRVTGDSSIKILEKPWLPINVHHVPFPITFNFFTTEDQVLIDTNQKEEKVCTSRTTIFANVFGDICGIHTMGLLDISYETLEACLDIAVETSKILN